MRPQRSMLKPKSEMNVVPYIDVMLVLLVIFMVTAPMITQGIQIELPQVSAEALDDSQPESIVTLSIEADGQFHWNHGTSVDTSHFSDNAEELTDMQARISALMTANPDTQVFIRADRDAGYGHVASAIAALQQAGAARLGLITETP